MGARTQEATRTADVKFIRHNEANGQPLVLEGGQILGNDPSMEAAETRCARKSKIENSYWAFALIVPRFTSWNSGVAEAINFSTSA